MSLPVPTSVPQLLWIISSVLPTFCSCNAEKLLKNSCFRLYYCLFSFVEVFVDIGVWDGRFLFLAAAGCWFPKVCNKVMPSCLWPFWGQNHWTDAAEKLKEALKLHEKRNGLLNQAVWGPWKSCTFLLGLKQGEVALCEVLGRRKRAGHEQECGQELMWWLCCWNRVTVQYKTSCALAWELCTHLVCSDLPKDTLEQ